MLSSLNNLRRRHPNSVLSEYSFFRIALLVNRTAIQKSWRLTRRNGSLHSQRNIPARLQSMRMRRESYRTLRREAEGALQAARSDGVVARHSLPAVIYELTAACAVDLHSSLELTPMTCSRTTSRQRWEIVWFIVGVREVGSCRQFHQGIHFLASRSCPLMLAGTQC